MLVAIGAQAAVVPTEQVPAPAAPAKASSANELSIDVCGFAQADAIYDFKRVDPDWEATLRVSAIPVQSGEYGNDGNFTLSVRQSRPGIKGNYGDDISFKLEGELVGMGSDQGQTTFRLRHAWATYQNFGMGQTWSNFMDIDLFPNTIDYWGPTGMVFYRNQQARYTFPIGEDEFSVSLEDPGTALTAGRFRDAGDCDVPNAPTDYEYQPALLPGGSRADGDRVHLGSAGGHRWRHRFRLRVFEHILFTYDMK